MNEMDIEFKNVRYTGTNDYIAKKIWSNPNHLKSLVDKVFGINIDDDIRYLNVEEKINVDSKEVRYDVIVKCMNGNTKIITETQNNGYKTNETNLSDYLINRSIHYLSTGYASMYETGELYYINKYAFIIWIVNFKIPNDESIMIYSMRNSYNHEIDRIKMAFVSLPNIANDVKIDKKIKDFFGVLSDSDMRKYKNHEGEVFDLAKTITELNEYEDAREAARMAELNEISRESEIAFYRQEALKEGREEGIQQGREEGIQQGIQEGIAEANETMILKFYNKGFAVDTIAEFIEKSEDEIKEILKKHDINV